MTQCKPRTNCQLYPSSENIKKMHVRDHAFKCPCHPFLFFFFFCTQHTLTFCNLYSTCTFYMEAVNTASTIIHILIACNKYIRHNDLASAAQSIGDYSSHTTLPEGRIATVCHRFRFYDLYNTNGTLTWARRRFRNRPIWRGRNVNLKFKDQSQYVRVGYNSTVAYQRRPYFLGFVNRHMVISGDRNLHNVSGSGTWGFLLAHLGFGRVWIDAARRYSNSFFRRGGESIHVPIAILAAALFYPDQTDLNRNTRQVKVKKNGIKFNNHLAHMQYSAYVCYSVSGSVPVL
ncbi:hypothetical protein GQ42DRAFT_35506 [Ramicandelaber brevisporus]|nr:hypothetical protein GQ42DRAFT_35506 [Ramicandelaber brevisporus]